jgi:hypothetical protein
MANKIGNYPIKKYLGTMTVQGTMATRGEIGGRVGVAFKRSSPAQVRRLEASFYGKSPVAATRLMSPKSGAPPRPSAHRSAIKSHRIMAKAKSKPSPPSYSQKSVKFVTNVLDLGVNNVINLKNLMKADKKFQVAPDIKAEMKNKFEFYRVTLVANFSPGTKLHFKAGKIDVKSAARARGSKAKVHSISPLEIVEKHKVTKKFGINPQVKLFDIALNPGVSYMDERTYDQVHPLVIGNFTAKNYAWWDFKTSKGVRAVRGTQIVEFIVKQPAKSKTEWYAQPSGSLAYDGNKLVSGWRHRFSGKPDDPDVEPETFTVPLD